MFANRITLSDEEYLTEEAQLQSRMVASVKTETEVGPPAGD